MLKVYWRFVVEQGVRCWGEVLRPYSKAHGLRAIRAVESHLRQE